MEAHPAEAIFKALGDESRLAIVRILLEGESYVELLASRLSLTPGTVSHHLKKLESAGLVDCHRTQFYRIYRIRRDVLSQSLADLIGTLPHEEDRTYENDVLRHFFIEDTLRLLPAQRKKREIVLRHILDTLPIKNTYTENELSEHIQRYHADYCTIRREMITCGLVERSTDENGTIYRRIV